MSILIWALNLLIKISLAFHVLDMKEFGWMASLLLQKQGGAFKGLAVSGGLVMVMSSGAWWKVWAGLLLWNAQDSVDLQKDTGWGKKNVKVIL